MTSATTISNHTTICWACAEELPSRTAKCPTCGELQVTNPNNHVVSWNGERLVLRHSGDVPSKGCCVGCGRPGAGFARRAFTHIPTWAGLVWIPLMAALPFTALALMARQQITASFGCWTCWRCRGRELAVNLVLTVAVVALLVALPGVGMGLGDKLGRTSNSMMIGALGGLALAAAAAVVAKVVLSPRATAVRLHHLDEQTMELSFRCPQAIRA